MSSSVCQERQRQRRHHRRKGRTRVVGQEEKNIESVNRGATDEESVVETTLRLDECALRTRLSQCCASSSDHIDVVKGAGDSNCEVTSRQCQILNRDRIKVGMQHSRRRWPPWLKMGRWLSLSLLLLLLLLLPRPLLGQTSAHCPFNQLCTCKFAPDHHNQQPNSNSNNNAYSTEATFTGQFGTITTG